MVVVTLSGVPKLGGNEMEGRTDWIFVVTKTSLTRDVCRLNETQPLPFVYDENSLEGEPTDY